LANKDKSFVLRCDAGYFTHIIASTAKVSKVEVLKEVRYSYIGGATDVTMTMVYRPTANAYVILTSDDVTLRLLL